MMKKLLYLALLMPFANFAQTLNADFEDGAVPPVDWTLEQTNMTESWQALTDFPIIGTGSANVNYDALVNQDERLISPSIDFSTATTVSLKFTSSQSYYWGVTPFDNYDTFVEVSTDGGFTWNQVWSEDDRGVFTSFVATVISVDLSAYAGNSDVKIAFRYVGLDGAQWAIDNVSLVTCLEPTTVATSGITTTGATATWAGSSATYELEYGLSAFTPGTGMLIETGSPYTFAGLIPSTAYQYYIRSKCSETSYSEWVGPFSFTTVCEGAADVPMTQDFESATAPALPGCTSTENLGTGNDWTVNGANGYGFPTKALRYKWNAASAANTWFFTQPVNLVGGQSYTLTYKYGASGTTFIESMKVSFGMGASAAAMRAEPLADHPSIINNANVPYTNSVAFTPETSGVYNIGFNAYSIADRFYLFLDDISLDVTLGTKKFDASQFDFFPNPVKDVLTISYNQQINAVEVYNMLGQKVASEIANADQKQINMSGLSAGSYMVKVYAGDMIKTIKVVKQ